MGIYKLMSLLNEKAPDCIRKANLELFSGRSVACDASMAMYQFLVVTQSFNQNGFSLGELTDKDGNKTGHLVGLFNRSIQFLENGIKPVWVFDGKPPTNKNGELARRKKIKEEAMDKMNEAQEEGNMEEALKNKVKTISITRKMKEDAIQLLQLMGMPVIVAPCEAEAQCAELARSGKVYAVATEDMDALTFRTPVLLRGFNSKKEPITEINYDKMLEGLELNYEEFVDLCILCGCDYTENIDGVGPATALKLIKDHKNIENIL
jgi:flap endonuclease-1